LDNRISLTQGLYQQKQLDKQTWQVTFSDQSHAIFKAHFKFMPLLPAFLQIDIAAELAGLKIIAIKQAKYIKPIKPNDQVEYSLVEEKTDHWLLKITDNTTTLSLIKIIATKKNEP